MNELPPILPNTSLCAIVRDEAMNAAGGIVDFVNSTVPFVERAIIVDTGSVDGTRELLADASQRFPHLEIYDHKFCDHAESRNYALKKVKTDKALVLDADELLLPADYAKLLELLAATDQAYFHFGCLWIFPDSEGQGGIHNPRLFKVKDVKYSLGRSIMSFQGEKLVHRDYFLGLMPLPTVSDVVLPSTLYGLDGHCNTGVDIKHFLPKKEMKARKKEELYGYYEHEETAPQPAYLPSFRGWKTYNPKRDAYRAAVSSEKRKH